MQCCEEIREVLFRVFYDVSSSFLLLFILFYVTFNLLAKIFHYCGSPILQRSYDGYDYVMFSDEEEEEEEETQRNNGYNFDEYITTDDLVADIIHSGETLQFLPTKTKSLQQIEPNIVLGSACSYEEPEEEVFWSPADSESQVPELEPEDSDQQEIPNPTDIHSAYNVCEATTTVTMDVNKTASSATLHDNHDVLEVREKEKTDREEEQTNLTSEEKFLILPLPKSESKELVQVPGKNITEEEIFGDSFTVGSTSKSSSEWRSSINCRDSGTDDPFSSSSRRSCPKWESYTVFQKYDEEMLFLDRISAQKLHETESLRSMQACPKSISGRIVHKLSTKKKRKFGQLNPYHELEAAYVAQICLTWEALNWNYNYFRRLRASRRGESDPGCPAYVAQQFQQFLVLLQRYVENEPYEYGRRPEIYARMRSSALKLLQVPEYRDSINEEKESVGSRISSNSFLVIMEESIRTFMDFLKADRESHCQKLAAFFKRNRRSTVDPNRLLLLKKLNKKKKLKLKDLRCSPKCIGKRRLKEEEEMEILMALIDIKVVSRVLRMADLSEDQLSWCDNKMSKVRVADAKLQRESSPLFFPAH